MKIAFDLDGTLDRRVLTELCRQLLLNEANEISIITGVFVEASGWQDAAAKREKLTRLGIPYVTHEELGSIRNHVPHMARLYVLNSLPATFDRTYRLQDLGLRKGALCERLGVQMIFDDSAMYCEMIPKMSGDTLVLKVGDGK